MLCLFHYHVSQCSFVSWHYSTCLRLWLCVLWCCRLIYYSTNHISTNNYHYFTNHSHSQVLLISIFGAISLHSWKRFPGPSLLWSDLYYYNHSRYEKNFLDQHLRFVYHEFVSFKVVIIQVFAIILITHYLIKVC